MLFLIWSLLLSVFVCLYDFLFIISSEQLDYDVPSRILSDGSCAWHSLRFLIHVLMYFVNSECFQQVNLGIFFSNLHCLLSSGDSDDMEWMWDHLRPSHNSYMLCSFFKMFFFSVFITTFKFTIFCHLPQIPPIAVFNPISHFITFIFEVWAESFIYLPCLYLTLWSYRIQMQELLMISICLFSYLCQFWVCFDWLNDFLIIDCIFLLLCMPGNFPLDSRHCGFCSVGC